MLRYFSNLEFYPDEVTLGPKLQRRRNAWVAVTYLLLAAGVFAREVVGFSPIAIDISKVSPRVAIGALVVGLALLPPTVRWMNRQLPKPNPINVLMPFSVGFFANVIVAKVATLVAG